jgi:alcohol dehydrogenase class IV
MALRNLKNALVRLRRYLELPEDLAQAGVSPRQVRQDTAKILEAVLADPCCATNPVPVTADGVKAVLSEVTGRG